MKRKMEEEIAEEQCGFVPGKGTRDQILNLKIVIEKNRERKKNLYLCFIDYHKAFDTVTHEVLWKTMIGMGFPKHIILLIKNLYENQTATVKTSYGLSDFFQIGQGVRQGCILSPNLFNIFSEQIMRSALADFDGTVTVGGRKITNLRYADDIVLISGSMTELTELTNKVNMASKDSGLHLNSRKTKVMKIIADKECYDDQNLVIGGEEVETVSDFCYLDTICTDCYDDTKEIKRRIAIAKTAVVSLAKVWNYKSISFTTKMRILKCLVFPIATYGAECWVMKDSDRKRIKAFELWAYRRLLRIKWVEMRTNEWVVGKLGQRPCLLQEIDKRKLSFVGHVIRSKELGCDLIMGMVFGKRNRGRPKMRFIDNIKDIAGIGIARIVREAEDRENWRRFCRGATADRLNDLSV